MLRSFAQIDSRVPVIFITGHGTVESAIEATNCGAYDYLFKPLELDEIRTLLTKHSTSAAWCACNRCSPRYESCEADAIVGRCRAMKEVYKAIGRVASQNLTVLLLGESGTGKEVVAQAIYHHSARSADLSKRSIVLRSPMRCWKARSLVTKRVRLRMLIANGSASLSRPTRERCSWMKWVTCHR